MVGTGLGKSLHLQLSKRGITFNSLFLTIDNLAFNVDSLQYNIL